MWCLPPNTTDANQESDTGASADSTLLHSRDGGVADAEIALDLGAQTKPEDTRQLDLHLDVASENAGRWTINCGRRKQLRRGGSGDGQHRQ